MSCPESNREIPAIPWREEKMMVAAAPSHPLAGRETLGLADLARQHFVAFDDELEGLAQNGYGFVLLKVDYDRKSQEQRLAEFFNEIISEEEDEWRLVRLDSIKGLSSDLDFQAVRGRIIPHVISAGRERLPLLSVIVGPATAANGADRSVRQALRKFGYPQTIEVNLSEVSYRP